MCKECGCGLPGESPVTITEESSPTRHRHEQVHPHDHEREGEHDHPHAHAHVDEPHEQDEPAHTAASASEHRLVEIRKSILDSNDRQAERNRGFFAGRGLLVLNVLSSPGSGKTLLLTETLKRLKGRLNAGVIVGDLATDNDAQRLRSSGAPVVQVTTGTVCHLEADMIARATKQLDLARLQLLIIENVGNLVCPASYDLGEHLRIVLFSVTEGEDKPLKYPPMFQSADVVVISKTDLAAPCDFDRPKALLNLQKSAPRARLFEISARTGAGFDGWLEFLLEQYEARRAGGFGDL